MKSAADRIQGVMLALAAAFFFALAGIGRGMVLMQQTGSFTAATAHQCRKPA